MISAKVKIKYDDATDGDRRATLGRLIKEEFPEKVKFKENPE